MTEDEKTETEKEKDAESSPPAKARGKIGLIKLGLLGVVVLVLLSGGFFGWKILSKKGKEDKGHESAAPQVEVKDKKNDPAIMIPLESFVINLADSSEIKYLKITINLEVDSEKSSEEVQTRIPQIRDAILMLLTSKSTNDVKDIGGKLKLQDEMIARINTSLSEGKVKAAYFTEFVMQ